MNRKTFLASIAAIITSPFVVKSKEKKAFACVRFTGEQVIWRDKYILTPHQSRNNTDFEMTPADLRKFFNDVAKDALSNQSK